MGYYAAGGYYGAGGFSFKKLTRFVGKAMSNPIVSGLVGLVPGGSTLTSGISLLKSFGSPGLVSAAAAGAGSTSGTPGHNAFYGGRRGRGMRRSRRRRY